MGELTLGRIYIASPQRRKELGWRKPHPGKIEKVKNQYLIPAIPKNVPVVAIKNGKNTYDFVPPSFTWIYGCGYMPTDPRYCTTTYCGDSQYHFTAKLDDGLWMRFYIDTVNASGDFGDEMAKLAVETIRTENEYRHVISYDSYEREEIVRGERILDNVPFAKLLDEKASIVKEIARAEERMKENKNKDIWLNHIARQKELLRRKEFEISLK